MTTTRPEAADHLETLFKELGEALSKDLGPVGEEILKALEKAAREVSDALGKEGIISKELRQALERAGDELSQTFKEGGPLDEQARDAAEKARQDMREAVEKAREELRRAVRDRADKARERRPARVCRPGEKPKDDEPAAEADGPAKPGDVEQARREVRQMEQQLRQAMRRLEAIERREQRLSRSPRRGPGEPPSQPPAPPRPPAPPERPEGRSAPPPPPKHRCLPKPSARSEARTGAPWGCADLAPPCSTPASSAGSRISSQRWIGCSRNWRASRVRRKTSQGSTRKVVRRSDSHGRGSVTASCPVCGRVNDPPLLLARSRGHFPRSLPRPARPPRARRVDRHHPEPGQRRRGAAMRSEATPVGTCRAIPPKPGKPEGSRPVAHGSCPSETFVSTRPLPSFERDAFNAPGKRADDVVMARLLVTPEVGDVVLDQHQT